MFYCVLLFLIFPPAVTGEESDGFSIAPYLLDITENEATVAFRLSRADHASVIIMTEEGEKRFAGSRESQIHFIRVTGLLPGKRYRYEVVTGEGNAGTPRGDPSCEIRTAGRPGESFSFVVYGDSRPGENKTDRFHREIIEQIARNDPAFCLVLGDMVDDGTDRQLWEEFFSLEKRVLRRAAIYPVIGDNDYVYGRGLVKEYFPMLQNNYYAFSWSGVYFFGLFTWDSRGSQPRAEIDAGSAQLQWFENQAAQSEVQKAPYRVVFMHDPVLISRGRPSGILRRVWEPVFRKYRVDVVFASWHLYERSSYNGVCYIISGGAGAELIWMNPDPAYPSQVEARKHHFCRVDVNTGSMTINAIEKDGTVIDSFTLSPHSSRESDKQELNRLAHRIRKEIAITGKGDWPVLSLHLFSYDCAYCKRLIEKELPSLSEKAGISLTVYYYDLGADPQAYDLFMAAGTDFGRQNADIPAIFTGNSVLGGEREITEKLPGEFTLFKQDSRAYREKSITPFQTFHDTETMKEDSFFSLTTGMVIGAGLLDGINPCAFTTLIFLISYLSLVGQKRKDMLLTGGLFTTAVFLTYLAIGFLFYHGARILTRAFILSRIINYILLGIVTLFALLSVIDFIKCLKGKETEMTLQLPDFLKKLIHQRIRNFARSGKLVGIVAFALGIVIAGMELACTGQVYIPIVTMILDPVYRTRAAGYLIMYNLAFIAPLAGIFLLLSFGITSAQLGKFFKKYIAFVKLGLTLVFLSMAVLIIYNLHIL
ncbi:MAG: metallophosphoesterase [Spirochaetales bacterium]|nr:metallophosphoesterase [Spirochaetales bacterium]